MFIFVIYRDSPELTIKRYSNDIDLSQEKTLLVNPDCPVRIMAEYIRNNCKLGKFTSFDLCDEDGRLKRLFSLPTYFTAKGLFEQKMTYYLIVFDEGSYDKTNSIIPQLNHSNKLFDILKERVTNFMLCIETPGSSNTKSSTMSSQASKPAKKKKK